MKKQPVIGLLDQPGDFPYDAVLEKGKPVHDGDYFSIRHPKMDCRRRAKIFAPFAALKGFEEEVGAKEVRYVKKRELDSDELYELNACLCTLHRLTENRRLAKENQVKAEVEYFVPCEDSHHEAYLRLGRYRTIRDTVWSADALTQNLRIGDQIIPFDRIFRIVIAKEKP